MQFLEQPGLAAAHRLVADEQRLAHFLVAHAAGQVLEHGQFAVAEAGKRVAVLRFAGTRQPAQSRVREHAVARQHRLGRLHDRVHALRLAQKAMGPGSQGARCEDGLLLGGQHQQAGGGLRSPYTLDELQPVHSGEAQVKNGQRGPMLAYDTQRRRAVVGLADDREEATGFQSRTDRDPDGRVVVDDHCTAHDALPASPG